MRVTTVSVVSKRVQMYETEPGTCIVTAPFHKLWRYSRGVVLRLLRSPSWLCQCSSQHVLVDGDERRGWEGGEKGGEFGPQARPVQVRAKVDQNLLSNQVMVTSWTPVRTRQLLGPPKNTPKSRILNLDISTTTQ